ncbi:hypothetical protein K8I61_19135 [bacterium]|nr:hypothetical protein [bacterium]
MKRAILIALVLGAFLTSPALAKENMEIDKGTILIGGSSTGGLLFGDHTMKPDKGDDVDISTTMFTVLGYGGYFVKEGIAIGPIVGIAYGSAEVDQKTTDTTVSLTAWEIGVQGIYIYQMKKSDQWAPFGALALEYVNGSAEFETKVGSTKTKTENDMTGWAIAPRGGVMVFLHPRFALDMSVVLRYISGSGSTDSGGADADFDLTSMNYGLMVGLNGFLM